VRLCVFTEIYNTTLQEREKSDRERKEFIDKARGSFAINKRLQLCEYITLSDLDSAESMNSASTASSYYSRYSCCSSPHAIHTLRTQTLFMYKYVISVIEGQVHHTLTRFDTSSFKTALHGLVVRKTPWVGVLPQPAVAGLFD
jgi:hypothetical protein